MYFRNSQARRLLPMPAGPMTDTSRVRLSRAVAWNRSLSRRSSSSRPTNGASSALAADCARRRSATTRRARHAGDGRLLALEQSGRQPARMRSRCRPRAKVASPTRTVPGGATRLQPRGGVDEVAGDHALVGGADRHRGLAGQHAGARLARREPMLPTEVDQVERGADRALGVVLVRDRRAPDRHDRVADELLDRAAVAADDVRAQVEVAGERLADVFRVALLGERREADEIGEQDGDQAPLGDWVPRTAATRRGDAAAGGAAAPDSAVPHSLQNLAPGLLVAPQFGQPAFSGGSALVAELGPGDRSRRRSWDRSRANSKVGPAGVGE